MELELYKAILSFMFFYIPTQICFEIFTWINVKIKGISHINIIKNQKISHVGIRRTFGIGLHWEKDNKCLKKSCEMRNVSSRIA